MFHLEVNFCYLLQKHIFYQTFNFQQDLPVVFIDTYYDIYEGTKSGEMYKKYVKELWDFADRKEPFDLKDIKIALNELAEQKRKIQSLTNELNNKPEAVQSMRFDSGQFVGFGFGMLLMGFVISGVVIFLMNKRNVKSFDLTA